MVELLPSTYEVLSSVPNTKLNKPKHLYKIFNSVIVIRTEQRHASNKGRQPLSHAGWKDGVLPSVGLTMSENAVVNSLTPGHAYLPRERESSEGGGGAWVMNGDRSRSGIRGICWPWL